MVSAVDAFYDSKFKDNAPAFACAVLNVGRTPLSRWRRLAFITIFFCDSAHILA